MVGTIQCLGRYTGFGKIGKELYSVWEDEVRNHTVFRKISKEPYSVKEGVCCSDRMFGQKLEV